MNLFHLLNIKYMIATYLVKSIYSSHSSSREPVQEIDRSIELELEFISYNIRELKSMVYISARYTYQWIGFLADLFYLTEELAAPLHSIINILALLVRNCCLQKFIIGLSSQDLDLVAMLREDLLS